MSSTPHTQTHLKTNTPFSPSYPLVQAPMLRCCHGHSLVTLPCSPWSPLSSTVQIQHCSLNLCAPSKPRDCCISPLPFSRPPLLAAPTLGPLHRLPPSGTQDLSRPNPCNQFTSWASPPEKDLSHRTFSITHTILGIFCHGCSTARALPQTGTLVPYE